METELSQTSPPSAQGSQIVHVLFVDIVGYSTHSVDAQSRLIQQFNAAVQSSRSYQRARAQGSVFALATGDGSALVFLHDYDSPARCALELAKLLPADMRVRMGIHSGLAQRQTDINGQANFAGEGLNTAQRIMDFGQPGHILISGQYASWLVQSDEWRGKVIEFGDGVAKHGLKLQVYGLSDGMVGLREAPRGLIPSASSGRPPNALNIVILYKRKAKPDDEVLAMLEQSLGSRGHGLFIDRHLKIGVEWAKAIEEKIRSADAVIAILSDAAVGSEMLEYELETAFDENRKRGKPYMLPVRVGTDKAVEGPIGSFVNSLNFSVWYGPQDNERVLAELLSSVTEPPKPKQEALQLEPVGGAVSPDSPFYVERDSDPEFLQALRNHESIVLVKGPRQMGKTSMIGRGVKLANEEGWRAVMTDFQKLSVSQLASEETFYKLLAATLAKRLNFKYDFQDEWLDVFGANMNMDNFLRALLEESEVPLVWFMDEADKLFGVPFASDFFGLVRSWHNCRATEPSGPWSRLSVVIGYATEAHLFIQDLNQSPFNVGRQLELGNFSVQHLEDLNRRYGFPLSSRDEIVQLHELVGGQPFLTRRAYDVLSRKVMDFTTLMATADRDDGPFGDHLKRILISVSQLPSVLDALRNSLSNPELRDTDGYHRLLAAGIVNQTGDRSVRLRCELYRRYLSQHLSR